MDDAIDRLIHLVSMPLWGPACLAMRALDFCVGDTYQRALDTAESVAARLTTAAEVRDAPIPRTVEARAA